MKILIWPTVETIVAADTGRDGQTRRGRRGARRGDDLFFAYVTVECFNAVRDSGRRDNREKSYPEDFR